MPASVKVFVSYSRQDASYLEKDSLLGFLEGLEKDGVEFWTDRKIQVGESWDEVIKSNIQSADIALVLVSQGFLDSEYCQDVEIRGFLSRKTHLFPVILSPCDWPRHDWLKRRQFLPGGEQTVEEHFQDPGRRKRLFLEIREQLRERAERIRREHRSGSFGEATTMTPASANADSPYSGRTKIEFSNRLGGDWGRLADFLEIPPSDQARFPRGEESRGIWVWLENRKRLGELPEALCHVGRKDLADMLEHNR